MPRHRTDNLAERVADIAKQEANAMFEKVWQESNGNFLRANATYDAAYRETYEKTLKELSGFIIH